MLWPCAVAVCCDPCGEPCCDRAVPVLAGPGRFLLQPGEALVIRGKIPECKFANVVLWNRFLQSFEYSNTVRPISLNRAQLNTNAAGEFAILLSDALLCCTCAVVVL